MKLETDIERAVFRCRVCRHKWGLDETVGMSEEESEAIHFAPEAAHAYIRCPSCKSPDFEVLKDAGF